MFNSNCSDITKTAAQFHEYGIISLFSSYKSLGMKRPRNNYAISRLHMHFCILLFHLMPCLSFAQTNQEKIAALTDRLKQSAADSVTVRLLLSIDSIYLYRMPDKTEILDSAILLSGQARDLSKKIGYQSGYEDAVFLLGNAYAEELKMPVAVSIMEQASGILKVRLQVMLGERYLFRPGEVKANQDSSYPFIMMSRRLSDSLQSRQWRANSLCLLGKYYFATGNIKEGKHCFIQNVEECRQTNDSSGEAHWWKDLAARLPDTDSTYADEIFSYEQAFKLYQRLGNAHEAADALLNEGFIYQLHNKWDLAESYYLQCIGLKKANGHKNLSNPYIALARITYLKGDYHKSIYYLQEALAALEANKTQAGAGTYYQLGDAYFALGDLDKSLSWYQTALQNLVSGRDHFLFPIMARIVQCYIQKNQPGKALEFIKFFTKQNPAPRLLDKEIVAAAMGDSYFELGKYQQAEPFYIEMIRLDSKARDQMSREVFTDDLHNVIIGAEALYRMGRFYVTTKAYDKASGYLSSALQIGYFPPSLLRKRDIEFLLFKVDSAGGRYLSAIHHQNQFRLLNDSIYDAAKIRLANDLKVKYETERKEAEFLSLRSASELQAQQLKQAGRIRTITYSLLIALFILAATIYSRYRLKQQTNRELEAKQKIIVGQYEEVYNLSQSQQKLLKEKEWLVKEIHHRVKNNLQIVISLLNAQAQYADNSASIDALLESRERMHTIAIIHQMLYQQEEGTSIRMQDYINNMIASLQQCLTRADRTYFHCDIAPIALDISQTVPLGLIINEAITNAVKHAFKDSQSGTVSITLKRTENDLLLLAIADNGCGLPFDFDIEASKTLGIQLIKIFSDQLEGNLSFISHHGLELRLLFAHSPI